LKREGDQRSTEENFKVWKVCALLNQDLPMTGVNVFLAQAKRNENYERA